jgi:hypothetical protein
LPVPDGAEIGGRVCSTAVPGFADVQETFTLYDETSMHFAYQATEGRPVVDPISESQQQNGTPIPFLLIIRRGIPNENPHAF